MATFEKVGKRWKAVIRKKGYPKRTKTFDTKKEASAWAVTYENTLAQGIDESLIKGITFEVLIRRYLAEETIKKKTAYNESLTLNKFLSDFPHITKKHINDVSAFDIAQWREEREKHVTGSTINREWDGLSVVYTHAMKGWGLPIKENPFLLVNRPKKGKPRDQRINEQDIKLLLESLDYQIGSPVEKANHKVAWCLLFAIETAMRLGEILKLENSDINGRIALLRDTKNGDDRKVPLSKNAMDLIGCLPNGFPINISSSYFQGVFIRNRPPELQHIRFHDTRHEALSRMAKKVHNPMDLAKISGHRDLRILLNTYYNPDDDHLVSLLD